MPTNSQTEAVRVHYRFALDDDDSGGPTGPDYLIVTMTPKKEDLRNRILREMTITIYLKEHTSSEVGEEISKLLNDHVSWVEYVLPKT
jgi:hypothetical protein